MGGCRAPVSLQLGHLPDSDGRPRCPRRQEEPLSDWVGYRGDWGRGEVEARHSEVWLGNGRGSHAWRDPQRLGGSGKVQWVFSLPIQALGRLLGSWIRSYAFWGPLQLRWAWVWGGRKGEEDGEGLFRIGCSVEAQRAFPPSTWPWKPVELPGLAPCFLGVLLAAWVLGA